MLKFIIVAICCFLAVFGCYIVLKKNKKAHLNYDASSTIIGITRTNNSYQPMLDVLVGLDSDLNKCGAKLHADMRGYLDYGKRK